MKIRIYFQPNSKFKKFTHAPDLAQDKTMNSFILSNVYPRIKGFYNEENAVPLDVSETSVVTLSEADNPVMKSFAKMHPQTGLIRLGPEIKSHTHDIAHRFI